AGRPGLAARVAPQARPPALAALPALPHPRRETDARARRSLRARRRDLANLHRRAEGLARRADDTRQGLRPRRRGSIAYQHEEPHARLRAFHPRRSHRPADVDLRRKGHAALRREAPEPPAAADHPREVTACWRSSSPFPRTRSPSTASTTSPRVG